MKRTLQILLFVLSLIPLRTGIRGFMEGAAWGIADGAFLVDFDSHYHYLSAVYILVPLTIWWAIPNIEKQTAVTRMVAFAVFLGGISRIVSLVTVGVPGSEPLFFLVLELVFPIVAVVMQARLAQNENSEESQFSAEMEPTVSAS